MDCTSSGAGGSLWAGVMLCDVRDGVATLTTFKIFNSTHVPLPMNEQLFHFCLNFHSEGQPALKRCAMNIWLKNSLAA